MIVVTQPGKPMPRAPKGTVMKKAAVKLYEQEINELYVISSLWRVLTADRDTIQV